MSILKSTCKFKYNYRHILFVNIAICELERATGEGVSGKNNINRLGKIDLQLPLICWSTLLT